MGTSPTTTSLDVGKIINKNQTDNQENANLTQWRKSYWINQKVLHKISDNISAVHKELLNNHNWRANICQHTEIFNVDNSSNNSNTNTDSASPCSYRPSSILAYFPHPRSSNSNCFT